MSDSITPRKVCTKCGRELPATTEYFTTNPGGKYGLRPDCRECTRTVGRQYYNSHKKQCAARSKQTYQDRGEEYRKKAREKYKTKALVTQETTEKRNLASRGLKRCTLCKTIYPATTEYFYKKQRGTLGLYPRCKSCHYEYQKLWNLKHPIVNREAARIAGRKFYKTRRKPWLDDDPIRLEKYRANKRDASRRWRQNNPKKHVVKQARRRARKISLPNEFTPHDWQCCLEYFNHCCAVCGRPAGLWHSLSLDHWIPLADVERCPGTVPMNIIPLCHGINGCNNRKHDKNPIEWLTAEFGSRKAKQIATRIQSYFDSLKGGEYEE